MGVYDFSVDYDAIAVDDILGIHSYLMNWICWTVFQWTIKNVK